MAASSDCSKTSSPTVTILDDGCVRRLAIEALGVSQAARRLTDQDRIAIADAIPIARRFTT